MKGFAELESSFVPGSKVAILGMVIQPLIGNPYNGYINPYYWVDDHPLLYGNNGSLDPSTFDRVCHLSQEKTNTAGYWNHEILVVS